MLAGTQAALCGQLTVAWDDNSTNETGFKVERSTDGVSFAPLATVGVNVTRYSDTTAAAGVTYWYRVCAFDATAVSAYSNPTSASISITSSTSSPSTPPTSTPGRLERVSIQAVSAPWGSAALTGSFAVTGSSKSVLLRAVGPGLRAYTSATLITDPRLTVSTGGATVASNDNWGGSAALVAAFDQVGAFPLEKTSKDAAVLASMSPASYSVAINGQRAGLALVEIFDADTATAPAGKLSKVQLRASVGTGEAVLVAGLTITGDAPLRLLIRAVGQSQSGLQGVLANPKLQLYRGTTLVKENDDWGGGSALKSLFSAVGASNFSTTSKDSAMDVSLAPGSYTAVISGVNGATGLARFEAFVVP